MRTFKRVLGFTLIELMVALAVAAFLYNALASYYYQSAQAQKDRAYANLHRDIAQAYANYITDNYNLIMNAMSGNLAVIKYSDLPDGYKQAIVLSGFAPCALIIKDSSGKVLFPLIVDVTNTSYTPSANAASGASYLGYYAGYLDANTYKSNSGWSIPNTSPYFNALSSCDYPNLVPKSMAINLVLAPFFMQPTNDISLNRVLDSSTIGPNNKNVEKADIVLGNTTNSSYNRILFNNQSFTTNSNAPYCTDGLNSAITSPYNVVSNIVCPQSAMKAMALKSVVADSTIALGTACTQNDLGKLYVESSASTNNPRSNLVCSYDPVLCTLMNNNTNRSYCYVSTSQMTKTFTSTGVSSATCATLDPSVPIAIDAKTNQARIVVRQAYCNVSSGTASARCGRGGATQSNLSFQYSGLPITGAQSVLNSIIPNGTTGVSAVYVGAQAPTTNAPATVFSAVPVAATQPAANNNCGASTTCCTQVCTNLYGATAVFNAANTIDCYCRIGTARGVEVRSVYLDSTYNNTNINSLTCTNKTVFR